MGAGEHHREHVHRLAHRARRRARAAHPRPRVHHGGRDAAVRSRRPLPRRLAGAVTPAPDAVVIGAGVVGAACADALSAAGLRVTVCDAGFAGGGTTGAGMGHIVVMDDSPAELALSAWSRAKWAEWAPEMPAECEDVRAGTLWIAADAS